MIDERINKTLVELERQLKEVDSAKKQVERTVDAYDGLKKTTKDYSNSLENIQSTLNEIVKLVGEDYSNKVKIFEEEIVKIQTLAKESIETTNKAAISVTDSVSKVIKSTQTKLTISIVISLITMATVLIVQFFPLIVQNIKHLIK